MAWHRAKTSRRLVAGLGAVMFALALPMPAALAQQSDELGAMALALAEAFVAGRLSPESARSGAMPPTAVQLSGGYWLITFGGQVLTLTLPAAEQGFSRRADITLAPQAGLTLRMLEARFGAGSPQRREKNAVVLFRQQSAAGEVLIFARLHTPKPEPASPVLAIRLRRE